MTVRKAMTFASAKVDDVESLIEDDSIVLEQKFDGTRAMCVVTRDVNGLSVEFLARNGAPLKHTAATQWIPGIKRAMRDDFPKFGEAVLDGEIMIDSGAYILFDLPYLEVEGEVLVHPEMTYLERRQFLSALAGGFFSPVSIGQIARTPEEKRTLFTSVMEQNGEGVMAKSLSAPFNEGKRVKHSLKVKFVKTADVVVMSVRRERNEDGREIGSIQFGVHHECRDCAGGGQMTTGACPTCEGSGKHLKPLGKCSPIGKPHCEVGDVIEVRYLYRQSGGALVQPTMLSVREDREPISCDLSQFADYSKAVV